MVALPVFELAVFELAVFELLFWLVVRRRKLAQCFPSSADATLVSSVQHPRLTRARTSPVSAVDSSAVDSSVADLCVVESSVVESSVVDTRAVRQLAAALP